MKMSSMKDDYTDSHDFCGKSSLVFVITNKLCWKTKAAFWQLGVKSMSDTGVGLPSGQNRCPVVSNAALHNALTLMIQPPPSHLGLQDSKHQLLERIPPPHPYTHTELQHGTSMSEIPLARTHHQLYRAVSSHDNCM